MKEKPITALRCSFLQLRSSLLENKDEAKTPFAIAAGKSLQLEAMLVVEQGTPIAVLRNWLEERGGLPKPNNPARSFQQELDLCRTGFLKTMWNEQAQGWSHCIGWAPGIDSPGYCSLLWMDSQLSTECRRSCCLTIARRSRREQNAEGTTEPACLLEPKPLSHHAMGISISLRRLA